MEPVIPAAGVEREVRRLVAVQFGEDEGALGPDTRLAEDLGADSLALVELLAGIEDTFGIELPDSGPRLADLATVAELAELVRGRLAGGSAAGADATDVGRLG